MSDLKKLFPDLVGTPKDYSKGENWMVRQNNGEADVDVFYLYPTAADAMCRDDVSDVDQYMKGASYNNFERGPSLFDSFTNIFAPYYRQLTFTAIIKCKDAQEFIGKLHDAEVRTDAFAALDYYFEHYNNGRPFILASHSQGSCTMQHVLSEYMKAHPDYYERMIAAYTIGMRYTDEYLEKYPHVKLAQDETDTGVVITWNTEGPGATMSNFPAAGNSVSCINPLNWKTDDTYAGIEENKGSYDLEKHGVIEGVADAQVDLERNVVVTKTAAEYGYETIPCNPPIGIFGEASFHFDDWNFYYENIKENAQKRIKAYFEK